MGCKCVTGFCPLWVITTMPKQKELVLEHSNEQHPFFYLSSRDICPLDFVKFGLL